MSFKPLGSIGNSLRVHSFAMQIIGENINHINSVGAKKHHPEFQEMVSEATRKIVPGAVNGWYNGVEAPSRQDIEIQGQITQSKKNTDLAIEGKGFFLVRSRFRGDLQTAGNIALTRNGQIDPLVIPQNGEDRTYLVAGPEQNLLLGWTADKNFNINPTANVNAIKPLILEDLNPDLEAKPSTNVEARFILDAGSKNNGTAKFSTTFVNNLGFDTNLDLKFVRSSTNTWNLTIEAEGFDPVTQAIEVGFNSSGDMIVPASGQIQLNLDSVTAGAQALTLDISDSKSYATKSGLIETTSDGYVAGKINGYYFGEDGEFIGRYDNGLERTLARLAIGDVRAREKLLQSSGLKWTPTNAAGELQILDPKEHTRFKINAGTLEQSTIDLADSFSEMIITQRIYSALTKVLTAADEMTKTATESKT